MTGAGDFWDLYWEVRLQDLQDLGKREAILAASRFIRQRDGGPLRLLELGCGEGQIIGALVEGHSQVDGIRDSLGVDYRSQVVAQASRDYPGLRFLEGDFTDPELLASLGRFELVLLVNALHEVFSSAYSPELGEVDPAAGKARVDQALAGAAGCLAPGGALLLFDGLEAPGDPDERLQIRFRHPQARQDFLTFAGEYHPFKIRFRSLDDGYRVELSRHDFTRYITKSIFLGKRLWQSERLESYQYFTEAEFRQAFDRLGLPIERWQTLTVDYEKWRSLVEIETPGEDFPAEHILILAHRGG
jgi:SAM-dependent methyltransferase